MSLVISSIILIGLISLSLVLKYPSKKILRVKPNPKHVPYLHLLGWSLFVISMAIAINTYGTGVGVTYWFGFLTLIALVMVFMLSYFRTD